MLFTTFVPKIFTNFYYLLKQKKKGFIREKIIILFFFLLSITVVFGCSILPNYPVYEIDYFFYRIKGNEIDIGELTELGKQQTSIYIPDIIEGEKVVAVGWQFIGVVKYLKESMYLAWIFLVEMMSFCAVIQE